MVLIFKALIDIFYGVYKFTVLFRSLVKMEVKKIHVRSIIWYCFMRRLNGSQMSNEINEACGQGTVNERTCRRWIQKFNEGNFDLDDAERSGRPSLDEDFDAGVKDYLNIFPRASVAEIATAMGHSQSTVWGHMKKIGLKYLSCKWVPHELSEANKESRIRICNELLVQFTANNFLRRLITVDETWITYRNEGTYKQTKCWAGGDIARVKNVSKSLTKDKVMAVFFWDCQGVVFWKLIDRGQTITSEVYCGLLGEMKDSIQTNRRRSLDSDNHGLRLQHDNARPHTARATIEKLQNLNLPCIPHPPYSPDLAPSDFYLFSSLKSHFSGTNFTNRNEVVDSVNHWLKSKDEQFFSKGINMLPDRWTRCVNANGDYFE